MRKYTNWILVSCFCLLLILLISLWVANERNYSAIKEAQNMEQVRIRKIKSHDLFHLERLKKTDSTFVINITDLEEANERFEELFLFVDNNTNRAESLINKDLDRMNLYMAIGIGFIGIIGIFVPILVNLISVQDLKDKLNEVPEKQDIDDALKNSKKALEKSETVNQLSEDIDTLNTDYNKTVPHVTSLIVQGAISRFFNMSPLVLTRMSRKKDRSYFTALLQTVKNAFDSCLNDDKHNISSSEYLKDTIRDFASYIISPQMHTVYFEQEEFTLFTKLSENLISLSKSTVENENTNISKVTVSIDEIIKKIDSRKN